MDDGNITYKLNNRQLQLFEKGRWLADVDIDWSRPWCLHIPHRIDWIRPQLNKLLMILKEKRIFLSPIMPGHEASTTSSKPDQDVHPLYLATDHQPITVALAQVKASLINECIAKKRALLASYIELHDGSSAKQLPKILGLRILGISPFPCEWAELEQFNLKKILLAKDRKAPPQISVRRLVLGR